MFQVIDEDGSGGVSFKELSACFDLSATRAPLPAASRDAFTGLETGFLADPNPNRNPNP